jgi:hypothetical protein
VTVHHRKIFVRRDHVDVIRLDPDGLLNLRHGHPRLALEQLVESALVLRRKVQDDDERHP